MNLVARASRLCDPEPEANYRSKDVNLRMISWFMGSMRETLRGNPSPGERIEVRGKEAQNRRAFYSF